MSWSIEERGGRTLLRCWVLMVPITVLQFKGLNLKIAASMTVAAGRCPSGAGV